MRILQIRTLIILLAVTLAGVACDNDSSTGPGDETAAVEGRVENNESQSPEKAKTSDGFTTANVDGATVVAAHVSADGSLETISGASDTTNADGEFTLNIDASVISDTDQQIVVVAEKNGQEWKTFVTAELQSGSTVQVKPLTVESSGEADIYAEVIAQGNSDIISNADIEAHIGAEAAAEIQNDSEAVAAFAEVLAVKAEAEVEYFASQSSEISEDQKQDIADAKAEAQAQLESDLYAASSTEDEQAARGTFSEAIVQAYLDADVDASAYAGAEEMSGRVLLKESSSFSADVTTELRKNAALMASYAIDAAIEARMEAQDAADASVQAAADAALALRSDIKALSDATEENVQATFESYNEAIIDVLEQEFSASAATIVNINTEINDTGGAKTTFETALEATLSTDVIIDAYTDFYTSVDSVIDSLFGSASDAEAEFVAEVMVLINLMN